MSNYTLQLSYQGNSGVGLRVTCIESDSDIEVLYGDNFTSIGQSQGTAFSTTTKTIAFVTKAGDFLGFVINYDNCFAILNTDSGIKQVELSSDKVDFVLSDTPLATCTKTTAHLTPPIRDLICWVRKVVGR